MSVSKRKSKENYFQGAAYDGRIMVAWPIATAQNGSTYLKHHVKASTIDLCKPHRTEYFGTANVKNLHTVWNHTAE